MTSPLREVRARLGLSGAELAVASRCSPPEVSRAERGGPIPQRLLGFLATVGVDPEALRLAQELYRQSVEDAIRERALRAYSEQVAT
jgi:transcriptional regulator with XRE-family HTH domain